MKKQASVNHFSLNKKEKVLFQIIESTIKVFQDLTTCQLDAIQSQTMIELDAVVKKYC